MCIRDRYRMAHGAYTGLANSEHLIVVIQCVYVCLCVSVCLYIDEHTHLYRYIGDNTHVLQIVLALTYNLLSILDNVIFLH